MMNVQYIESDLRKRRKCFLVSRRLLALLSMQGVTFTVVRGYPHDATILGQHWDEALGGLLVTVCHPSFPVVEDGEAASTDAPHVTVTTPVILPDRAITLRDAVADIEGAKLA